MYKNLSLFLLYSFLSLSLLHASDDYRIISIDNIPIKILNTKTNTDFSLSSSSSDTIYIPLTRVGNLMIIEAEIDTMLGNFILDLGAPYLVLNSTYFRDYKLDKNYSSATLTSENEYVKRTRVKQLNIQGLNYTNLSADITDLGAIENKRNIKILGLLGVSLFKDYVFDLNLSKQQLVLYKNLNKEKINAELILETPMKIKDNVISINATSKGVKLNFSLDTGAERNILDNQLPKSVYEGIRILNTSSITDANGLQSEALIASVGNIHIGGRSIGKSPTIIINLESMRRAYETNIDGMLGFPFFALGRVILDFKNNRLFIYQNNREE